MKRRDCLKAPAIWSSQGRRAPGDFAGGYGDPQNAYTKELLTAIPIRRCRSPDASKRLKAEMAEDTLDDYIDAASKALGLPVKDAWKPAVRANLEVSMRLARLVDEFALPDEAEPASVFTA